MGDANPVTIGMRAWKRYTKIKDGCVGSAENGG